MTTDIDVYEALKYRIEVDEFGTHTYRNAAGQPHRDNGPAVVWRNGDCYWYQNGVLHREDGPAVEYADGSKRWFQNGVLQREDGPVVLWSYGREER